MIQFSEFQAAHFERLVNAFKPKHQNYQRSEGQLTLVESESTFCSTQFI
jgi:hypothetical protein